MPVSCHFRGCKALLFESTHVSSPVASTQAFTFTFYYSFYSLLSCFRYYAICRPLQARYLHTVRRAAYLIIIFWVVSLVLLLPQLFIQRLEPLLIVDLDTHPQLTLNPSSSPIRVVDVCVEFFPDWRWNVLYTLVYYVVLCIFPVKRVTLRSIHTADVTQLSRCHATRQLRDCVASAVGFRRHMVRLLSFGIIGSPAV